jgi:hypothetical protein
MSIIIFAALLFVAGGFFAVALMSCFAIAKREDEQHEVMLAFIKDGYHSGTIT